MQKTQGRQHGGKKQSSNQNSKTKQQLKKTASENNK